MTAAKLVAAGRKLLNERFLGWETFINLQELNMQLPGYCVLGQLARRDPYMRELIDEANLRRKDRLVSQGWDERDVRPMPYDFFSACVALELEKPGRRALDFGFDFDHEVDFDEVSAEWRELIEEEQGKWKPLSE